MRAPATKRVVYVTLIAVVWMVCAQRLPKCFKLTAREASPRHKQVARDIYRAVLSRGLCTVFDVPLRWLSKVEDAQAAASVCRHLEQVRLCVLHIFPSILNPTSPPPPLSASPQSDTRMLDLSTAGDASESDLSTIITSCTMLLDLNLAHCRSVVDPVVQVIAQHCRTLRSLRMTHCANLTDNALHYLAEACGHLHDLDVSYSTGVSDLGVITIARHCDLLQSLCLNGCSRVTDAGLVAIAKHCHDLESLRVKGCTKVTDAGLQVCVCVCVCVCVSGCF